MERYAEIPLHANTIDYRNVALLRTFLTEQGKILPRRSTGLTEKQQARLTKAVKNARILALLPFGRQDA